jgi:hypothetical protein
MAVMDIPPIGVSGRFEANLVDPLGVVPPSNVYRIGDQLGVDCDWFIDGALASSLGGQWRVQLTLEGRGTALEVTRPPVPPTPGPAALDGRTGPPPAPGYRHQFREALNAGILGGQPSILVSVGVALTYIDAANTPGPIAAFIDLGVVQIFQP